MLDDVTPLHQITDEVANADLYLYEPRDAYRTEFGRADPDDTYPRVAVGGARLKKETVANNPPQGAMIFYYFADEPRGEVTVEILDRTDDLIRSFSSSGDDGLTTDPGMNRFVWDLGYPGVNGGGGGPAAVPGGYQVRLSAAGQTQTRSFQVLKDPRIPATTAELQDQFDLLKDIRDRLQEISDALGAIEEVREQVEALVERTEGMRGADTIAERGQALLDAVAKVEVELARQSEGRKLGYTRPMLRSQLGNLVGIVNSTDARPTDPSTTRIEDLEKDHFFEVPECFGTDLLLFLLIGPVYSVH